MAALKGSLKILNEVSQLMPLSIAFPQRTSYPGTINKEKKKVSVVFQNKRVLSL